MPVAAAGLTRGALDRSRDAHGRDHRPVGVAHGGAGTGDTRLSLPDALGPAATRDAARGAQDLARRADLERQRRPDVDDGAQAVRGFQGRHAQALVIAIAHIELDALAGRIA